mmetsp:Transcript_6518/g.14750  ORF Transcript_6518/g.14750 Transcript_6518/m.14750 type:complete len:87 (+) Transcript_6518:41-301(+)
MSLLYFSPCLLLNNKAKCVVRQLRKSSPSPLNERTIGMIFHTFAIKSYHHQMKGSPGSATTDCPRSSNKKSSKWICHIQIIKAEPP